MQTAALACARKVPPSILAGAAFIAVVSAIGAVIVRGRSVQNEGTTNGAQKRLPKFWIDSPSKTQLGISAHEAENLPYPQNVLPGGRDVETPYGSIHVFEWGPEDGERVLLLHGISTPCLALGGVAHTLVESGYRVMLFDFFGRGYSDTPLGLPFDLRLYSTQILLVLASSSLPWTGDGGFHLIGYSLGGGVAVAFASYFPHMLRSLTLVAGAGLIRSGHIGWMTRLLYSSGILPEWLLESLTRSRLMPAKQQSEGRGPGPTAPPEQPLVVVRPEIPSADPRAPGHGTVRQQSNSDVSGGDSFDNAVLPSGATVVSVMEWQLRSHAGFVRAFISTLRHAPIIEEHEAWRRLASRLAERRVRGTSKDSDQQKLEAGLTGGKVLLVLGASDPVIVMDELVPDATNILGPDGLQTVVLDAGHEVAIVKGPEVARAAIRFWEQTSSTLSL
ncbi:hypothetical protein MAPG_02385 [Magnaporthiopsis poae ATCC 64411]|uniref:AB hydrolase-1 domain-containing protein n=1 Tax=Magnaporthiopsis poae (strain ATCC 64411 / 73-15) TaxID=644358 RepID=A0A0C4DR80_MAGP6|nr:hypothetical protein MAPG_02385 [Magnaporthiopsis poae ATCC 64411]